MRILVQDNFPYEEVEKRERAERQREKDAFPYDQRTEKVSSAYGMIGRDQPQYSSEFFSKMFLREFL